MRDRIKVDLLLLFYLSIFQQINKTLLQICGTVVLEHIGTHTKSKHVLDLGSSPGSWSQIICNINKNATIDAFDILDMKYKNSKIKFYKKNIL